MPVAPVCPVRRLAAFAIPFSAAIFVAVYLLPAAALLPAALLCVLPALFAPLWKGDRRRYAMLIPAGLTAGLLWFCLYSAVCYAPAQALDAQTVSMTATVLDWPVQTDYGVSVVVRVQTPSGPGVKTILYAAPQYKTLSPGDRLTGTALFHLADTVRGDKTDYYRAKGIFLTARAKDALVITLPAQRAPCFWPAYIAKALKESLAACFEGDVAAFLTAVITGDKRTLPGALSSAFRRTGLAHVVAVSGLHISFLAGLVAVLLGKNSRRAAVIGIAVLFGFAVVVGNTPSVLRAAFLQSALLVAPLCGRENDKITSLSTILMLLLVGNPFSAASVSLQLSFAAVAGIYLLTGALQRKWTAWLPTAPGTWYQKWGCRAFRFGAATLATTAGALLFTTPLMAIYFQSISLIAPLSNLLGLWAVSAAFLGGLVVAVIGIFAAQLGGVLALFAALPARYILWLAPTLARFPFAAVPLTSVYLKLWLLLAYLVLLIYLLWRGVQKRPIFPVCACCITLCAAILCTTLSRTDGALSVTALDVGQGQCVALCSGGKLALVDCGGASDAGDVAGDYVQSLGLNRVELLILTHFHADHAGGVAALLDRLSIGAMLLPDVTPEDPMRRAIARNAAERGIPITWLSEDATVAFADATLRLYAPLGGGGGNEEGLSVLCSAYDFHALITGDMNAAVEKRLIKYGDLPDIDLLLAGHHGSDYASSAELLAAVTPEYALISVGYNTYGHPAPGTLLRLADAGCRIYRTDQMGNITVTARVK